MKFKVYLSNVFIFLSFLLLGFAIISGILSVLHLYSRALFDSFFNWLQQLGIVDWEIYLLPIITLILSILFYLLAQKFDKSR